MTPHRIEHDSLGKIQVPHSALFGAQTQRAIENYCISQRTAHPALLRAYLRIKWAAAITNEHLKVIDPKISLLIQKAIQKILKMPETQWPLHFPVDPYQAGAGTSQNMNINEVVANVANQLAGFPLGSYQKIHPNDHVNRSQSTNDTFPTAMRLALLEVSEGLVDALQKASQVLRKKAHSWEKLPKAARTHLQDAVPMTLGQEFMAYSFTLKKCADWIELGRDALRDLGIGGSAAGTGLTVPRGYTQRMIKELEKLTQESLYSSENLIEAMQSQAHILFYSSMLKICAVEMTRLCNDWRLLASGPLTGLSELRLPAMQPGSSIMPGKVNPSILEMTNQTWYSVLGYDQTVTYCTQAGQLELNVMMPMMAYSLLEATSVATQATRTLTERCLQGLEPHIARLHQYFETTPQVATALNPKLGYEQVASLVQEALAKGVSVLDLVREKKLLTEKELRSLLNIQSLTGL